MSAEVDALNLAETLLAIRLAHERLWASYKARDKRVLSSPLWAILDELDAHLERLQEIADDTSIRPGFVLRALVMR